MSRGRRSRPSSRASTTCPTRPASSTARRRLTSFRLSPVACRSRSRPTAPASMNAPTWRLTPTWRRTAATLTTITTSTAGPKAEAVRAPWSVRLTPAASLAFPLVRARSATPGRSTASPTQATSRTASPTQATSRTASPMPAAFRAGSRTSATRWAASRMSARRSGISVISGRPPAASPTSGGSSAPSTTAPLAIRTSRGAASRTR